MGHRQAAYFSDQRRQRLFLCRLRRQRHLRLRQHGGGPFSQIIDDSGYGFVGVGDFGVNAIGEYQVFGVGGGGRFEDTLYTGVAFVAHGNEGIYAQGSNAGGEFRDSDSGGWGQVGRSTYKIYGSGAVSFVQNHPDDASKVVVYHAPEASEVAVYTRGSARLSNGVASVELDETFQWVANPDLGLTAHLTPRGLPEPLAVESLSTTELVVRGSDGSDAAFDFLVYGLRIGFEELAPVQAKEQEAFIPAMDDHAKTYDESAAARRFNAFERFAEMTAQVRGVERSSLDLTGSGDLVARIGRYDHELHAVDLTSEPQRAEPVPPGGAVSAEPEQGDEPASTEDPMPIPAIVRVRFLVNRRHRSALRGYLSPSQSSAATCWPSTLNRPRVPRSRIVDRLSAGRRYRGGPGANDRRRRS